MDFFINWQDYYTPWDFILFPLYVLIFVLIALTIQHRNISKNIIYKYFAWGLIAKIIGAISLCFVYTFYYKQGGDTLNYHDTASAVINLLLHGKTNEFFSVWLGELTEEKYYFFNSETDFPKYWGDKHAFMVARLIIPFELLGFNSFLTTSVIMAFWGYTGVWALYRVFCDIFPELYKQFAVGILFVPSVLFWGSGILKDNWTFAATGWYTWGFYHLLIKKERRTFGLICMLIASWILIYVKPYIFIALMPGSIIWGTWDYISGIRNPVVKGLVSPLIIGIGSLISILIFSGVGDDLGQYSSIDTIVEKAYVTQQDLKQEYYQGSSFDIGDFEPSLPGMISKFHVATIAGLFRPFLWESRNPQMVISGLENFLLLFFAVLFLLRNPLKFIGSLTANPLVLFSLSFAILFAFSVGISTSNFGALVRLRIPLMPFFICALFIINIRTKKSVNG
jgi:hypothetical protein